MSELIRVPDIGSGEGEVIELFVKVGDRIEAEQSLLTLESDKASMEIPAPKAGVVKSLKVKLGDRLKEGDELLELESDDAGASAPDPRAGRRPPRPRPHRQRRPPSPPPRKPSHPPLRPRPAARKSACRTSVRPARRVSSRCWSRPATR